MANDYLVNKWKQWYKSLDVNHDGTLSEADMDDCVDNYVHLTHFSEARIAAVKAGIRQYWQKVVLRGQTGNISEEEFVAALKREYDADTAKFCSELRDNMKPIADAFDENSDGSLSQEEVVHIFQSFGHTKQSNLEAEKDLFNALGPVDGLIPVDNYVEIWYKYLTSVDDSERDIIVESLEKGA